MTAVWAVLTNPDTWPTALALSGIAAVLTGLLSAHDRRHNP